MIGIKHSVRQATKRIAASRNVVDIGQYSVRDHLAQQALQNVVPIAAGH